MTDITETICDECAKTLSEDTAHYYDGLCLCEQCLEDILNEDAETGGGGHDLA